MFPPWTPFFESRCTSGTARRAKIAVFARRSAGPARLGRNGRLESRSWTPSRLRAAGRHLGRPPGRGRTSRRSPRCTPTTRPIELLRSASLTLPRTTCRGCSPRRATSRAASASRWSRATERPWSGGRAGSRRGEPITLAGVTMLRFDDDGKVVDHRDYWNQARGPDRAVFRLVSASSACRPSPTRRRGRRQ